jgi:two-component system NtrC family sensor kinase
MSAEPFILFFLLRYIRKTLRKVNSKNEWNKTITILLYAIVIFFIAGLILKIEFVTNWVWHLFIFSVISIPFIKNEFASFKTLMYAILPFAIVSLLIDLTKLISSTLYGSLKTYLDAAGAFSIIWMIAMIYLSRKQRKALELEHQKTREEEEQKKLMAIRKDELEKIIEERTSELRLQKEQVESALTELKTTQTQLVQSEKMASLGELTAGIAHEIQNPLNFVNNFSEVNTELIEEMYEEIQKGNIEEVKAIANDIRENEKKIGFHGKRADAIVKGMLQHSRNNSGEKELTDINALADEYLRLGYHGLRAKDKSFNATLQTDFDGSIGKINIISQDVGRVILNLFTNSFYSVSEKQKLHIEGYDPIVSVSTKKLSNAIEIRVKDNGMGISPKVVDKIFQPFFTTKPTGEGTGLGLSLSYDIITKGHRGTMKIETKEGEFAEFIVHLPI